MSCSLMNDVGDYHPPLRSQYHSAEPQPLGLYSMTRRHSRFRNASMAVSSSIPRSAIVCTDSSCCTASAFFPTSFEVHLTSPNTNRRAAL